MGEEVKILGEVREPEFYDINDNMILPELPPEEAKEVPLVKGPGIAFLPLPEIPQDHLVCPVSLKGRDNISTDDITPASAELSSMRSDIPLMSRFCYMRYDPGFAERAKKMGRSVIIAGENYGQGSSREHAAINPMYLGVKCVIAKSIARIHRGNLISHGVVPMYFEDGEDYERLDREDILEIEGFRAGILERRVPVKDLTKGLAFTAVLDLSDEEAEILLDGGLLRHLKKRLKEAGIPADASLREVRVEA